MTELIAIDNEYRLAILNEFNRDGSVKRDVCSAGYKFIRQLGNNVLIERVYLKIKN